MELNSAFDIYHFLFETYAGIGIMVGAGIVISIILCVIFEIRTRKLYHDHPKTDEDDDWSIFDDIEEGEEEQEEADKRDAEKS